MTSELDVGLDFDELFTTEAAPRSRPAKVQCAYLEEVVEPPNLGTMIGIDLGTTNSCAAICRDGRPEVIRSSEGYHTIPSLVGLSSKGKLLVGHRAKTQILTNPGQTIYGAKRLVGRPFDSLAVEVVGKQVLFPVCRGENGRAAVSLGSRVVSLEEIQGIILRECKEMAEVALGHAVYRAVVTVPAYYSELQREAVRTAGWLAGLRVERILNEPTAAALAFGLGKSVESTVLIYDLGGGTFDVTVMRIKGDTFEVLATGGDTFLGGSDFDNQLVVGLLNNFKAKEGKEFSGDLIALSRIVDAAENAKVALSEATTTDVHLGYLMVDEAGKTYDLDCTVTRDELELLCTDLVERTQETLLEVLAETGLNPADIDDIIVVGGQSRMPLVRRALRETFGKEARPGVHADEAIALGAALFADSLENHRDVLLMDVLPKSIGVGLPGGVFKPVIEKNTSLPMEKSFKIAAPRVAGEAVELSLFQGEERNIAGNDYLGTVRLEGVRLERADLLVTLKLDTDCILHVSATDLMTRRQVAALFQTLYTPDEVGDRLKIKPGVVEAAKEAREAQMEKRPSALSSLMRKVVGK